MAVLRKSQCILPAVQSPMKVFALLLSLTIPASAQEIVRAIELPRATLSELAAIPLREQPRVIEQRWLPPFENARSIDSYGESVLVATNANGAAPPNATVFDADTSDELSPPDASGAVGPQHVVSVHNSGLTVQTRGGARMKHVTLAQFWFSSAPIAIYYDPRVVYDAQYDRWVVISIYDEKAVMLAVSETGDPQGAWRRYQINEDRADYAQLVLSGDSIVAGTTHWDSLRSYFFVVPRTAAYANPETLSATRIDSKISNAAPVASATQKWYVVGNALNVAWAALDNTGSFRAVNTPNALNIPADIALPQAGGGGLDGGFGVVESAVEHGGWIYTVSDRVPRGTSQHVIEWCRFHPVSGQATWGLIADADSRVSYAYPSLAVNDAGAVLIGFGIFSASTYPSSGYVYRDVLGNWSRVGHISAGDSAFNYTDRWGDYTTTLVDPSDGTTFWTLQMHTRGGTWATSWARVYPSGSSKRRTARH
jgi:hypothetical protein